MPSLPHDGDLAWGDELNSYLGVSLNADGTLVQGLNVASAAITMSTTLTAAKHNTVDATAGALSEALPTGQPDGTVLSVEKIDSSTNTISITGNIRDVGSSTITLVLTHETVVFKADASGSWWPYAGHKTLGSLDNRYSGVNNILAFGAVEDGTTDNRTAILAAITAAQLNSLPVCIPWKTGSGFGFSGLINFPDNVDLMGTGLSVNVPGTGKFRGARLKCLTATSTIAIGNTLTGGNNSSNSSSFYGSISGNLIIDGNNVSTNPVFLGRRVQARFGPIIVMNGAAQPSYSAGTAYTVGQRVYYQGFTFQNLIGSTGTAPVLSGTPPYPTTTTTWQLVADSAAVIVQEAQNNTFDSWEITNNAGAGIIFDGGCGALVYRNLEINNSGANGYQVHFIQTYNTGPGSASPVYSVPTRIFLNDGNIERQPASAIGTIAHVAGTDNTLTKVGISSESATGAYSMIRMMFDGTDPSTRLRFRDCFFFSETAFSTLFEIPSGCELIHSGTIVLAAKYAYLLYSGAFVEEIEPDWTGCATAIANSGSVAIDGIVDTRHSAGVLGLSSTSRSSASVWSINSAGTAFIANLKVANGDLGGGSSGVFAMANTTHMPTANPNISAAMAAVSGAFIAHTSNGSIPIVAGNWQNKSVNYTMLAGDAGVFASAASGSVTITLPTATTAVNSGNTVGLGTEIVIRRTDNSGNTLTVAIAGSDTILLLTNGTPATSTTLASLTSIRLVSDGNAHWVQV